MELIKWHTVSQLWVKKKKFISGTSSSKMAEKMPKTNLALDATAHQQQNDVNDDPDFLKRVITIPKT